MNDEGKGAPWRALALTETLREFYGLQPVPPPDPFQFFLWELLSVNTLPARRDLAWHALRRIPALTPDAVFRAPPKKFLDAVGLTGPNREDKAERIRTTMGEFRRFRQQLGEEELRRVGLLRGARALRRLSQFDAAARGRALLFAAGYVVLPVDQEMSRVVTRFIGDPDPKDRSTTKRWLAARLPREWTAYRDTVIYLRHHARHTCTVVAPHCTVCPLRAECLSRQDRLSVIQG